MPKKRFKFLSTEAFLKLSQREKVDYLARASTALGRTLATKIPPTVEQRSADVSPGTLGAVLYPPSKSKVLISESEWVELVESVTDGEQRALHALCERTRRLVFALAAKIIGHRGEAAEAATLDTCHDIWRCASVFDHAQVTVLGWIMNLARARALERLTLEQENPRQIRFRAGSARPAMSLQRRLARRIAAEMGKRMVPPPAHRWAEPDWDTVAPGISCKMLATDTERHRVSMLVRLDPGGEYPPHTHVGVEELHLLEGELWIDDRKLYPGDYNRAVAPTGDKRVYSETGCTCVLITSTRDILS